MNKVCYSLYELIVQKDLLKIEEQTELSVRRRCKYSRLSNFFLKLSEYSHLETRKHIFSCKG